jgi:uncharacterized protein
VDRDQVIALLRQHTAHLRASGVRSLVIFGPLARLEGPPGCPVDLLLEIEPPQTFDRFLAIKTYLRALLARPVELVVESPQHPLIQEFIQPEAIAIL